MDSEHAVARRELIVGYVGDDMRDRAGRPALGCCQSTLGSADEVAHQRPDREVHTRGGGPEVTVRDLRHELVSPAHCVVIHTSRIDVSHHGSISTMTDKPMHVRDD